MKVADFDFELPPGLIAQAPAVPRDSARMLVVEDGHCEDSLVRDLPRRLEAGDVLVVNDTRVIPARLAGRIGGAGVQATLTKREGPATWRALAKPGRKFKLGARVVFASPRSVEIAAEVKAKDESGEVTLAFDFGGERLDAAIGQAGIMPLPPYIKRPKEGDPADRRDYQTLFAARDGAVAAPTAGLHFTPALVAALEARNVAIVAVTLHVGAGTFLPVKTENVENHRMHPEWGEVSESVAGAINAARRAGNRVVAVGSTALRLLESAANAGGRVAPWVGETDIFIVPGYRFRVADLMLTNFHLPRSTLFMLVCAFAGTKAMKRAYAHAIERNYRFYSYGDCCLLARAENAA